MAYPALPGRRLAYDIDGTEVFEISNNGGNRQKLSQTVLDRLNNEHNTTLAVDSPSLDQEVTVTFLFSRQHDLFGVYAVGHGNPSGYGTFRDFFDHIEYSPDVHTDIGGTWIDTGASHGLANFFFDRWREDIQTIDVTDAWGLRGVIGEPGLISDLDVFQIQIYGAPNDVQNPNRLVVIDDDTGLEFTSVMDWGELPRGTVKTHIVQIKNNSSTHQADGVSLGFSSLNVYPEDWHRMKDGGGGYGTTLNLGDIAASATYVNDITLKVDVPDLGPLGPFANRLTMTSAGWSE